MTQRTISIDAWLSDTTSRLHRAGIDTARLDAMVILGDQIQKDKSWLLAHPEHTLQGSEIQKLSIKITQRIAHVPLAYIRGYCEFYGRDFEVNDSVLVPRPETESLIVLLNQSKPNANATIYDIGTGSGCIAITAKLEHPLINVFATDISSRALKIANRNAQKLNADVYFAKGDLLNPLSKSPGEFNDLFILANLPYVPEDFAVNRAASHEPSLALYSGLDGLHHYRRLFTQLVKMGLEPSAVITESMMEQRTSLEHIAAEAGYRLKATDGLGSLFAK